MPLAAMDVIFRWSPMAAALLVVAAVDVAAAGWVWRRSSAVARRSLALLLTSEAVWCAAYGLELVTAGRTSREFWGDLEYLGTAVLPIAWLMFVLEYTGRRPQRLRAVLALLAAEPLALFAVLALPWSHDLVRSFPPGLVPPVPVVRLGPVFWVHLGYTTLLAATATVILVARLLRVSRIYVRQSAVLAISVVVSVAANAASSFGLPLARRYDPTPIARRWLGSCSCGEPSAIASSIFGPSPEPSSSTGSAIPSWWSTPMDGSSTATQRPLTSSEPQR
jgi:hypothetical protein